LNVRADAEVEARVEVLRRKANEGTLTPEESAEYLDFVEAVDIISISQAKARKFLSRQAATRSFSFHIEHVVAKQHGGSGDPAGLALACGRRATLRILNMNAPRRVELRQAEF
jgi:hypothetical protein